MTLAEARDAAIKKLGLPGGLCNCLSAWCQLDHARAAKEKRQDVFESQSDEDLRDGR